MRKKMAESKRNQARFYNQQARPLPALTTGDPVRVQKDGKWDPAIVTQKHDDRSYTVRTNDGEYRRNRVHLNKSAEQSTSENHSSPDTGGENGMTRTRSGRISKPPDRWSPC